MAATNFTPIQIYFSTTASAVPLAANLAQGELAINITDGKLYYEDNAGAVQVIATKGAGTIGGSTTQIQYNNAGALAGNAAMVFNNSTNVTTLTTLNLTNALGAIYGGTAQSTYAQGDIVYASATNTLSKLGIGTVNFILTSNGTVPQWVAPSSISVLTATNLAGGAAGSVPYQSGVATTTFLAIGTANRVMTSTGTAPQWVTSLTGLTGVSSSSITNTGLTATRVVFSTTAGLETDSANLTFDGTILTSTGFAGPLNGTVGATTPTTGAFTTLSATGVATFSAGTAALPAITTTGDTNTGIFFPAADTIAFTEGGVESMRIDSSGNVGIGTTSPVNKLDVRTAAATSAVMNLTSGSNATQTKFNIGQTGSIDWDVGISVTVGDFYIGGLGGSVAQAYRITRSGTAVDNHIWNTGGTERMRIDSSGNVGIGTSSPIGKLDINGGSSTAAFAVSTNSNGSLPSATPAGLVISQNYTNGAAEIDFFYNQSTFVGDNGGFRFYQRTGASTVQEMLRLTQNSVITYTGGTERMRIDSSGRVLIGTSSSITLANGQVSYVQTAGTDSRWSYQTTNFASTAGGSEFGYFMGRSRGASVGTYTAVATGDQLGTINWSGADGTNLNSVAASITSFADGTVSTGVVPGRILFNTASSAGSITERMRIDSSGNVGIGTTSPTAPLSVSYSNTTTPTTGGGGVFSVFNTSTSSSAVSSFVFNGVDAGGTSRHGVAIVWSKTGAWTAGGSNYGSSLAFWTRPDGGDQSERMRIDSSGNVGIGQTSITRAFTNYNQLNINGSSGATIQMQVGSTTNANIVSDGNALYLAALNGTMQFAVGGTGTGTERMRIDSSGNLLVGTTATSNITKLTTYSAGNAFIAANTNTSNLTTPAMQVSKGDNNTTTSNVLVQFLTNGFVNGQGQINANGSSAAAFGSFSDKRLKENIVDLPSQLEKIMALRPVEFDYVESIGGGHQIGFIAQEVQTVYPDLVGVGENEMLTLTDLNKNDARLIKCIQEQQALITSLTARITALEST